MGPGEHRPRDHEYWMAPWSTTLFVGDLFEAIPFGDQPTVIYTGEEDPVAGKHFVGEVAFGFGLLITPTCDMTDQQGGGSAHPYRVLVPVLPLRFVAEQTGAVAENQKLLRSRDAIHPYMYLPPLEGVLDEESVACLFRPSLVSDEALANPPRRIAQLQAPARRHLKVKLAAYWARVAVDPEELPLHERDEELAASENSPPSQYDRLLHQGEGRGRLW
jgi:hypothetical protein